MELNLVWETLEQTALAMENGQGKWSALVATAEESIRLLFDFTPTEILEEAKQSHYPTKPLIKWLLYEGQKISDISEDKLQGLCNCWNDLMGAESGNISFPVIS